MREQGQALWDTPVNGEQPARTMFEGAVAGFLNWLLGKYIQDLDTENLNGGIFSGNVNLTDLKLKPEALYELDLPIDVKIGTIGKVNLQIPWSGLYSQPVVMHVEDVLILVGPAISNSYFDPEREKRLTRAAKRKILQDLEAESEVLKGPQNFFKNLFTAIMNNLQIYVRNVHVRYEDSISSKDGPLACGLCLQSLSIETTNNKWKPSVTPSDASTMYKIMRVESLSLYWNPTATALDDVEIANITPMQYYNWKHYMLTGLDKFSMHHEDFEFLLKPVACKVKVLMSRSVEPRVPRLLLDAVIQDSEIQLSRRQYLSIDNLMKSFERITLNRKYRHLHPGVPLAKDPKKWWRYAYNAVVEQRVRPYTWAAIKKHRENYNIYKQTYKSTLRSPNDTELKLDLQKCEDSLPIISVVIAREQAKFELLAQEPDRIEVVETEIDWWDPLNSDKAHDSEEEKSRVDLCVKTARSKSLWSHLSSPEKKKVCELIGYVEGAPRQDKSKQHIEHKVNLTLANSSITLMNRNKEVLVVTLTQFLASLETRPHDKAYKISTRTESMVIEGLSSDNDLMPILLVAQSPVIGGNTAFALDVEKNPANSHADLGICCHMEPMDIIYVEHAVTEIINFFQTHSMSSEDLVEEACEMVQHAGIVSKSVLAYAASRKKVFHVNMDLKGPCLILPENGCAKKPGNLLVLDVNRIVIKSDLQPPNLTLEDATCMELEERLYDRFHAECSYQILFCDSSVPWQEARKVADSDLHLIPRVRAQLVFSTSIKKDYKLLPRYKLNISLSSLKLNLSDRVISELLDYLDNVPLPVPNTVPVSFIDSGDYAEEMEDPELAETLQLDRVRADPGYGDLVKLRQKIVAAYFSRNRAAETQVDGTDAQSPAEESLPTADFSDEDVEEYARSVDLPGFDDNVSPSNTINTLMRFVIGEIVISLERSGETEDKPYIMLSVTKVCLDVALMQYGPAIQLAVRDALLVDKQHSSNGKYLELLTSSGDLFNLLYRKVRANCPEFRSHFHSVEHSLVADVGAPSLLLHATALRSLVKYLQHIHRKIQKRDLIDVSSLVPKPSSIWEYLMKSEADPPVPPGATKFSYSVRVSSATARLWAAEGPQLEMRIISLESDCVFRANDRLIFKMFLGALHVDDLSESTLYPKLVWPDEDKVIEAKYVRAASGQAARPAELRVYVGRLHVVLFCCLVCHVQQLMESLIPSSTTTETAAAAERAAAKRVQALRTAPDRLSLAIEIHAPTLLLPQKPASPNLLVFNTGDLLVENFFKTLKTNVEPPAPAPVVDNILVKLVNITLSRAVMTLAGTLEVQEPILEPISIKCDIKRTLGYSHAGSYRELLLCEADVIMEMVLLNLGQKDLATVMAVWCDNLSDGNYISSIIPTSPVEAPSDVTVKKLQAFFAQGEPIKKESVLRFSLDGIEMKLFSDMDEILSSPVRDLSHGLAKLTTGEASLLLEHYSDGSLELRASLQSLLVEDIRPDTTVVIRKMLESQGGGRVSDAGGRVSVARPALLEAVLRRSARAVTLDLRLERTRLNLSPPFLLRLARALLDSLPGERLLDGGLINHGYVADVPLRASNYRSARFPSTSDSTSGYFSAGNSISEDPPSLSISVQCRQPEVMFFTDLTKPEGQALLFRTELLIDYSSHSNTESLVISLAGLQIMSKLQSKLKNLAPQCVLKPCDLEFSKSFKNVDEGIVVKMSVSEIDVHIAATTVHTVMDIIEEISTEMTLSYEKDLYHYTPFAPRPEKIEENLWAPKKLTSYVDYFPEYTYAQPKYPTMRPAETFIMTVPNVRVMFELEQSVRVPVLSVKLSGEATLHDWTRQLHGSGSMTLQASTYNDRLDVWEPLIEPLVDGNRQRPWDISATIFQEKSYPMSAQLATQQDVTMTDEVPTESAKKTKKREFESETSADEADSDNEMVFIRNPNGKQNKYSVDLNARNMTLGVEESDSENEGGKDKLSNAIGQLFNDSDSSADEYSNDEDSSAPEQSEVEASGEEEKPVSYVDGQEKIVTLQEPSREDSVESSDDARICTYVMLESRSALDLTFGLGGARVLRALGTALTDRTAAVTALVTDHPVMQLVNDIGPGSTVTLRTRAQTDIAGNDLVLAVADYEYSSRPSTPGGDISGADLLEDIEKETKPEMTDISDEWDCFEGGFPVSAVPEGASHSSPGAPPSAQELLRRVTDLTLSIRLHDFEQLTILCPQRSASKLHVLHPSKNGTRYYVVVDRAAKFNNKRIVVRSPLQVRNETSYALELLYRQSELAAVEGAEAVGAVRNPFCGLLRLAVLAPHETYDVPLYVAYHCRLYLAPTSFESYQAAEQGIWWMDLANDIETPRDVVCPSMADGDSSVFAMRVMATEGCQSHKVSRTIPNLLIRVLPPLGVHNRLPHALQLTGEALKIRVEAGERAHVYSLQPAQAHRLTLEIQYLGLPWSGSFTLTSDMVEKTISMTTDCETEGGNKRLIVRARLRQGASLGLLLYAPCWVINKTGLPLQIKGRSDECYSVTDEALLWGERGVGAELVAGAERVRVRAQQSGWSRAARLLAHAPGLLVCAHAERRLSYRLLLHVTLSELCPQLTKIVTLLPYFLVYNDTRRHLRFMEENEAADLWIDLAPQQCTPFWPQTDSMAMHCKYRDSTVVSQHFPITTTHFTVLRMDKGTAICVDVTGGTDRPFTITFKTYTSGDAPVRIDNLCEDLFLKMHQVDSGQVALLSPYQSMLYTWDDPLKERKISWNIYNNKGKGFIADFSQDGHGQIKVSYRSVKNSTVVVKSSVTSKLSSTLNRLAPKSPELCSSSSDDSDSSGLPEIHAKGKKMRKDKVIVYWISFMDNYQRVFALAQDEKIIGHYRSRVNIERSLYEVYVSLASVGLSVCVPTNNGVKELSYISLTDSLPKWEIHVGNKWKQLAPDITAWIEEKYQAEQKKCQLKEFLHIDLEKMHMTKPFFSEMRRIYSPGVWLQFRKSFTYVYHHLKLYSFQIDNQLHEAVFPNVLHPAPGPNSKARNEKPAIDIVALKHLRPGQDVYKYVKILVQEYCVNLDRGFVNYVFDILNNWKIEEKPAVRLRADLALVHMPLPVIAMKSQTSAQRDIWFEFVHLSPVKLVLSLSSRGYSTESGGSPSRTRYGQRENRPKLFNSDLLEFLFNSWGSSLCDMKDVVIRMNYLEIQNAPLTVSGVLDAASRHYWLQLVQQFYVLVLGLNILGNPYSYIGDFTKGLTNYYEPYMGSSSGPLTLAGNLLRGASQLLRSCSTTPSELHKLRQSRRSDGDVIDDLPEEVIEAYRTNPTSVALALIGLIARPSFDVTREAARLASARGSGSSTGVESAEAALRACVERGGGLVARKRLPRFCSHIHGIRAYCASAARGAALLALLSRGHYADTDSYVAHAHLSRTSLTTILVSTQHIFLVRTGGAQGGWRLEWVVQLDELIGAPIIRDGKLILNIKQDEMVNYFSTDEKVIEIQDPEVLTWLQKKIECALIQALEDKRCAE